MTPIFETEDVGRDAIPLKQTIPFWFAISSPLIGVLVGLVAAWFVAWIST
jgi:hypothetical protein